MEPAAPAPPPESEARGATDREIAEAATRLEAVRFELRRVIVGQDRLLETILVALLGRGHVLLEGVPGLAKTLALETAATVSGGSFSRVQFTPDLVPADVVGGEVLDLKHGGFFTRLGPVFANFVLADEINRAPAKVQSALLEVMAEGHATIAGTAHAVPRPFFVLATQNPIESEGVYPLPEAQVDRFAMKALVGYPTREDEQEIVQRMSVDPPSPRRLLDPESLVALQGLASRVFVAHQIRNYAVDLVGATRDPADAGLGEWGPRVELGASPRASLALVRGARARAVLNGRGYALVDDVAAIAPEVLRHRIVLSYGALADGTTTDEFVAAILDAVPRPNLTSRTVAEGGGGWASGGGHR